MHFSKKHKPLITVLLPLCIIAVTMVIAVQQVQFSQRTTQYAATTTNVNFTLFLHGLGKAGDNSSDTPAGNVDPVRKTRTVQVEFYDSFNNLVTTKNLAAAFDGPSGAYKGTLQANEIQNGSYTIRVKTSQYLAKFVPGTHMIAQGKTNEIPPVKLVTGDIDGDNKVNALVDYTLLLDCFSSLSPARNCADENKKKMTDLNDDNKVDDTDYNLFLRELAIQHGDGPLNLGTSNPTIGPEPTDAVSPNPSQPVATATTTSVPTLPPGSVVVSISAPANNSTYTYPSTSVMYIQAYAQTYVGSITDVQFWASKDGGASTMIGHDTTPSTQPANTYIATYPVPSTGKYVVTAKVFVNGNLAATSASVTTTFVPAATATVTTVPTLPDEAVSARMAAPANNAIYQVNTAFLVKAQASTTTGTISKVEFQAARDGGAATLIGTDTTATKESGTTLLAYSMNYTPTVAGTYQLSAKIYVNGQHVATAPYVTVKVNPAPSATSPIVDLTVDDFYLVDKNGVKKTTFFASEDIYVQVNLKNAGNTPSASGATTGIFSNELGPLSTNTPVAPITYLLHGSFAPGTVYLHGSYPTAAQAGQFQLRKSWQSALGTFTARAFVDYKGVVSEANDANNQKTFQYTVIAAPSSTVAASPTPTTMPDPIFITNTVSSLNITRAPFTYTSSLKWKQAGTGLHNVTFSYDMDKRLVVDSVSIGGGSGNCSVNNTLTNKVTVTCTGITISSAVTPLVTMQVHINTTATAYYGDRFISTARAYDALGNSAEEHATITYVGQ